MRTAEDKIVIQKLLESK